MSCMEGVVASSIKFIALSLVPHFHPSSEAELGFPRNTMEHPAIRTILQIHHLLPFTGIHGRFPLCEDPTHQNLDFPREKMVISPGKSIPVVNIPYRRHLVRYTLPETNQNAPENGWLEYYFPIGEAYFQGRTVSFREGKFSVLGKLQ